ncbi:MAG: hypothetical protein LUG18_09320 [Candidatus Azobacteroides sp.]|nr:hypothetical protein [Candidatus Azobacteroides sp.]
MDERVRQLLNYFVKSNYNVIIMYNPQCREYTQRIIIYRSYVIPNHKVFSYTVNGKDITRLIENLRLNPYITLSQLDFSIPNQVSSIPDHIYEFSKEYAFESIRNTD